MTDKFNKLNETFEVEGEVISKEIKKVEPKKLSEEDIQKTTSILVEICIL